MSSATGFQFRGACEPCHRRKIRCIIPPGQSSCTLCTHSGIACLFAPRRKPGRPKRQGSSNGTAGERQASPRPRPWSDSESPPAAEQKYETAPVPEYDTTMPDMDADSAAMNVFWSSLSNGDESYVNTANWGDAATQLSYVHHDTSAMNNISDAMQYPLSQPLSTMPPKRSQSYTTFANFQEMPHESFHPRSVPSSSAVTEHDIGFDTTMRLCKDLHEYRHHVSRRPSFTPSVHHNVFHDLLRMCTAAANMAPSSGNACPATALVLAAMLQFLELCGLIIARLSDNSSLSNPAAAHLENMFLLKKMDLVLLPTKLFLLEKGHHAGVQKAQALHHEIEAVISNEYPQLAWGDLALGGGHGDVDHLQAV